MTLQNIWQVEGFSPRQQRQVQLTLQKEGRWLGGGQGTELCPLPAPARPPRPGHPLCDMGSAGAGVSLRKGGCRVPGLGRALTSSHSHPPQARTDTPVPHTTHVHSAAHTRANTSHVHSCTVHDTRLGTHTSHEHTAGCACTHTDAHATYMCTVPSVRATCHLGWLRGRQGPLPA